MISFAIKQQCFAKHQQTVYDYPNLATFILNRGVPLYHKNFLHSQRKL